MKTATNAAAIIRNFTEALDFIPHTVRKLTGCGVLVEAGNFRLVRSRKSSERRFTYYLQSWNGRTWLNERRFVGLDSGRAFDAGLWAYVETVRG